MPDGEAPWWYEAAGKKAGPHSADELRAKLLADEILPHTRIWRKGMSGWTKLADVEDFREAIEEAPPPLVDEPVAVEVEAESPPHVQGQAGSAPPPIPDPVIPDPGPKSKITEDNLKIWFQKIFAALDFIASHVDTKDGFLMFKTHTHSREELLQLPEFKQVEAVCGQIDDLVQGWLARGNFESERFVYYHDKRLEIESRIGVIKASIMRRKPTFWEGAMQFLREVLSFVTDHMHLLPHNLLVAIGRPPPPREAILTIEHDKL
jgi:hypothetical protein